MTLTKELYHTIFLSSPSHSTCTFSRIFHYIAKRALVHSRKNPITQTKEPHHTSCLSQKRPITLTQRALLHSQKSPSTLTKEPHYTHQRAPSHKLPVACQSQHGFLLAIFRIHKRGPLHSHKEPYYTNKRDLVHSRKSPITPTKEPHHTSCLSPASRSTDSFSRFFAFTKEAHYTHIKSPITLTKEP